jgi:ABC-type lipopolysaccharide export system ATPase subunit
MKTYKNISILITDLNVSKLFSICDVHICYLLTAVFFTWHSKEELTGDEQVRTLSWQKFRIKTEDYLHEERAAG